MISSGISLGIDRSSTELCESSIAKDIEGEKIKKAVIVLMFEVMYIRRSGRRKLASADGDDADPVLTFGKLNGARSEDAALAMSRGIIKANRFISYR